MDDEQLQRAGEWVDSVGDARAPQRRKDDVEGDRRVTLDDKLYYIMNKVKKIEERQRLPFWRRWFWRSK